MYNMDEGGTSIMHPFYGPSSRLLGQENNQWVGLSSMIMYLLFWAGAILIGVRLVKRYAIRIVDLRVREDSAMAILRERYAKGEIDSEEFRLRNADLQQSK